MGVLQRFEQRLERAVSGAFAKAFRSAVQPVELAAALQREVDNSSQVLSRERRLAPNTFVIELSPLDHERLSPYSQSLTQELIELLRAHAEEQHYVFAGPVTIALELDEELGTGRFRVRSTATAKVELDDHGMAPPPGPVAPPAAPAAPAAPPAEQAGPDLPPLVPPEELPPASFAAAGIVPPPHEKPAAPVGTTPAAPTPLTARVVLEVNGQSYPVRPPGLIIGRGSEADLRINDPGVSRRHAEIRMQPGGGPPQIGVVDLSSTNGTFLDGKRVDRALLHDGSQVQVGHSTITVRFTGRADV